MIRGKRATLRYSSSDARQSGSPRRKRKSTGWRKRPEMTFLATSFSASFIIWFAHRTLSKLMFLRCASLLPVGLSLYIGLVRRKLLGQPWFRSVLPLTLVMAVLSSQLPTFLAAGIAGAAILGFALVTIPKTEGIDHDGANGNQAAQPTFKEASPVPVMLASLFLVVVMLSENFMIWVVSATFPAGQTVSTAPPPLQDNGRLVLLYMLQDLSKRQVVSLRRLLNVQWALVSSLGASFFVTDVFLHPRRQLYTLGVRALLTLAAARICRTISFCLTVLPSQVRNCYQNHYPYPPPTDWMEWIWVGLLPASHGGCNDLIISGHATVTSTLACVVSSVGDDILFSVVVWVMVILDYVVEVYEGFHYSVDMWLGLVTVTLMWRVLHPCEPVYDTTQSARSEDMTKCHSDLSTRLVAIYSCPTLLAYLQLVLFPKWSANFLIVGYVVLVAVVFGRGVWQQPKGDARSLTQHFCQHTVLCLLYLALGVYL